MIPAIPLKSLRAEKAELTILKSLAYFDIFNYPLTENEIRNFLDFPLAEEEFRLAIRNLVFSKTIFKLDEFYSLQEEACLVEERRDGNHRAKKLIPRAIKIGRFLYRFPFVKAVAISGSLSKNYADRKADIDFFIIANENRLWIARTFLHLFKKLSFLVGRQHFYCMNYFIDEQAMTIQEQNIYSAIEVVTLLPAAGPETLARFFKDNEWTEEWLPCFTPTINLTPQKPRAFLCKMIEKIFDKKWGDKFDNFLFHWTARRWQSKEKQRRRNIKGQIMNMVTGKHFSKSNPEAFQEKIVTMFETKMHQLRNRWPQYFSYPA